MRKSGLLILVATFIFSKPVISENNESGNFAFVNKTTLKLRNKSKKFSDKSKDDMIVPTHGLGGGISFDISNNGTIPISSDSDDFYDQDNSKSKDLSKKLEKDLKDFNGYYADKYGDVCRESTPIYRKEKKTTYKSYWAPWQAPVTKDYVVSRYATYYVSHILSIPTKVINRTAVYPGQNIDFTVESGKGNTESQTTVVENSYSLINALNLALDIKFGVSILYDLIKIESDFKPGGISVSPSLGKKVRKESTRTTEFYERYTETFHLNNTSSERQIHQFNYRQKFRMYFTTEYSYEYESKRKGSGRWGRDDNFTYSLSDIKPVRTVFFLVDIGEQPVFEDTVYKTEKDGYEEPVVQYENNVLYI